MKSALFVDFDNVFSGLRRLDPVAADHFALQPQAWMRWIAESLTPPPHAPGGARRLLVRRCYLNPQVYQRFRPAFNRAGFEIIDCPAMTSGGKTSTDIHMVLDIVDLLQHQVHYDEFIVLSADADFTPVLRKLRRWDRRTTVLAIGFPSAAYQASADLLIDQDAFVREALGREEPEAAPAASAPAQAAIQRAAAEFVTRCVADAGRPVALPWLASKAPAEVAGLDIASWAGLGSFRKLMDSLRLAPLVVDWEAGVVIDPARHATPCSTSVPPGGGQTPGLRHPGHALAGWGSDGDLLPLLQQIHNATGMPLLAPPIFQALLGHISADAAQHPFSLTETGKRVRDRCRDAGLPINRSTVSFVLKGILLGGHVFGEHASGAREVADRFVGSMLELCRTEELVLDDGQKAQLRDWATRSAPQP